MIATAAQWEDGGSVLLSTHAGLPRAHGERRPEEVPWDTIPVTPDWQDLISLLPADDAPTNSHRTTQRTGLVDEPPSTSSAVNRLRRLSGLTWEQLAGLFGVSRRSVHFWASGRPLNAENEEHLFQVLGVLEAGTAEAHGRSTLMDTSRGGPSVYDLLCQGRYAEAESALRGRTPARTPSRRPAPLDQEAQDARRPPSPERLVGALNDRVQLPPAKRRPARTRKIKHDGDG